MDQPNDPAHSPRAEKIPLDLGSNWTHPNRGPLAQAIVFGPFVSLTAEVKARIFPTVPSFRRRGAERGWALIAGGAEEKAKDKAEVGERGGGGEICEVLWEATWRLVVPRWCGAGGGAAYLISTCHFPVSCPLPHVVCPPR